MDRLGARDPEVANIILGELDRQEYGLEMIPSENYTSLAVMEAMGTNEVIKRVRQNVVEVCKKFPHYPELRR